MAFDKISFIKTKSPFVHEYTGKNSAPLFRKKFTLDDVKEAKLYVCGLGIAYYYINGVSVSDNLFTAPLSDYRKTLWYNIYDVSHLLKKGENVIAVWCGNGWYNEDVVTRDWKHCEAEWRDKPKFILRLDVDGKTAITSNEEWKCKDESAVIFNALRSGEHFDARLYDEKWADVDYDDADWEYAVVDTNPPKGIFRECKCEPITEFEEYKPQSVYKISDNSFVFDIGQHIAGYVRLTANCEAGRELTIRYGEELNEDYTLQLNNMNSMYEHSDFQTDKFICGDKKMTWSPKFTYHGLRYIVVEGINSPDEVEISGVFVHQAVETRTEFECSDEFLNKLFKAGRYAVYSNMYYSMTDCPSREKLGWTNDIQMSAEQVLLDFKAEKVLTKWLQDIYDAMKESGELPGVVPSHGWGYAWGNGPVADGCLFELPYRIYERTGDKQVLIDSLPYFERYLNYVDTRREDGFINFGLSDWAKPGFLADWQHCDIPLALINGCLEYKFANIAALAADFSGVDKTKYVERAEKMKALTKATFINENGECTINKQTAVAMLVVYGMYDNIEPLKEQLKKAVEEKNMHHDCGIVGGRAILWALVKCGLCEYAYDMLTVEGYPGYRDLYEQGATALCEYWEWFEHADSKNHHMYSDFMSWLMQNVVGIKANYEKVEISPYYFAKLDYAKGSYDTGNGNVEVSWFRKDGKVELTVIVPDKTLVYYDGKILNPGQNKFVTEEK